MKIYDNNLGGAAAAETSRKQDIQQIDRSNTGQSSAAGNSSDRVELSGTLGRLSRALSGFQTDRASRVQSLAAQYQEGTYHPDSTATSHSIVSEALDAGS